MSAEIATIGPPTVTAEQIELIRRTVAQGATDLELQLHLHECRRRGVHPLDRQIHFSKRDGRYTPIVAIDYLRSQAAATGEMAGSDDPVFVLKGADVRSASVTVYRLTNGVRYSYTATARMEEYRPDPGPSGKADRMWRRMPFTMLAKCAEALALRKAFPQQIGGLYTSDELHTDPGPIDVPPSAAPIGVDVSTGEVLPSADTPPEPVRARERTAPAGYRYIDALHEDNGWVHVMFYDYTRQRPGDRFKTKLDPIARQLRAAFEAGHPVQLRTITNPTAGEPAFVQEVRTYVAEVETTAGDDRPA